MKLFRRSFAAFLAVTYGVFNVALSHAAESRFWEDRRRATQQASRPSSADLLAQLPLAAPWRADTPAEPSAPLPPLVHAAAAPVRRAVAAAAPFASLRSFQPPARAGGPVVFLIQDLHGAAEAQQNIASLLERWTADGPVWTGVEGAAGAFDFSADRELAGPTVGRWLAAYFIRENVLTGAEAAALAAPAAPTLWGLEDAGLYQAHARSLREGLKARAAAEPALAAVAAAIDVRKRAQASSAFLAFDRASTEYHGGGSLGAYARFLTRVGAGGAQLRGFTAALAAEETLDFKAVEAERSRLLARLTDRLAPADLQRLAAASLRLRAGETTSSAYYDFLLGLCRAQGVAVADLPAFRAYAGYVRRAEGIDRTALLDELSRAERAAADRAAATPAEKELLALSRDAALLRKLVRHEMTPEDWAAYAVRRPEILRLRNRLPSVSAVPADLAPLLAPFEDFCRLALRRDQALAVNAWANLPKDGVAAVVAGGFHTEGLARHLAAQGAGVAVLTPRISRLPDSHYADLFDRQPLPLEKLFAGDKVFLVRELVSSPSVSPAAAPGARAYRRTLIAAGAALRAALEKWSAVPAQVLAAVRRMARVRVFQMRTVDGGLWMSLGLEEEDEVSLTAAASLDDDDLPTLVKNPDESLKIPTATGQARVDFRRESAGLLEKLRSLTKDFKPAPPAPTPRQAMEAAWGSAMARAAQVVRKLQADPALASFSEEEKKQDLLVLEAVRDLGVASPRAAIWLEILRHDIPWGTGRLALKELEEYLAQDQPRSLPAGSALQDILNSMGGRSQRVFEQSFAVTEEQLGKGAMSRALDVLPLAGKQAFPLIAKRLPRDFDEEQERLLLWDTLVRWEMQDAVPGMPRILMRWGAGADAVVVMEKAHGGDLEQFMRNHTTLYFEQIYVLIERLLSDLAAMHAAGYLHNDIKPENILLMEPGDMASARLTDFNLAFRKTIDWAALHKRGRGTEEFVAPESFQKGVQNERTDLFQAGATFYYLLTGLFTHDPVLKMLRPTPAPADLGLLLPDMPKPAARFIMSLVAINPKDRPASAAEALAQWRLIAEDLPSPTLVKLPRLIDVIAGMALALVTAGLSFLLPGRGGPLLAMTALPLSGGPLLGALSLLAVAAGGLMVVWGKDEEAANRVIAERAVANALRNKHPLPVTLDMNFLGKFVEAGERSLVHKGFQVAVDRREAVVDGKPAFFLEYMPVGASNGMQKKMVEILNKPYHDTVGPNTHKGIRLPPPTAEPPLSSFKPLSLDLPEDFDEPLQPSAAKPSVPDPSEITQRQSVPVEQLEALRREVEEERSWEAGPAPSDPPPPTVRKPRGALSQYWESIPRVLLLSAEEEATLDHNTMNFDFLPGNFKVFVLDDKGNIRPFVNTSLRGEPLIQIHHDQDVGFFMDAVELEPVQQRAMDLLLDALNSGVRNNAPAERPAASVPAALIPDAPAAPAAPRDETRTLPMVKADDDDKTPIKDLSAEEWDRLLAPISSGTRRITGLLIFLLPPGWYLLQYGLGGGGFLLMMTAVPGPMPGFDALFVLMSTVLGITLFNRAARKDFNSVVANLELLDTFPGYPAYPQVNAEGVLLPLDHPKSAQNALLKVDVGIGGAVQIRPLTRLSPLQIRRLELLLTAKNRVPGRLLPQASTPPRTIPPAAPGASAALWGHLGAIPSEEEVTLKTDAAPSREEITLQVDMSKAAKQPVARGPEVTPVYPSGMLRELTAPRGDTGGNASLGTLTDAQSDHIIRAYADRLTADAALERRIMDAVGKAPWERWLTAAARENPLIKSLPPPRNIQRLLERVEIRLVPTALGFLADENGVAVAHYGTGGRAFGGDRRVVYLAAGPDGKPLLPEAELAAVAVHEIVHLFFLDQGLEHDTANVHSFATDVHRMASWAFLGNPDALDKTLMAAQRRVFSEDNLANVAKRASIVAAFPKMLEDRSRKDWTTRRADLEAARDAGVASPRASIALERLGGPLARAAAEKRQKVLEDALDGMATSAAQLVPDALESRYTIVRWIKSPVAEMTSLAIATDNVTNRQVVVKFLTERGFQEYAVHRELQDIVPGLPHVWRGGEWAGRGDAMVLEHAKGGALSLLQFSKRPMDLRDVLRLARPLLQTLSAMHKAGWLHNDIKPENIFFREAGDWDHPLLGDLGNASRVTKKHAQRHGTLFFMAPETLAAPEKAKDFVYTPQTDLYQLGVVLYRLASGKYPFDRESTTDRVENDPVDIRRHDPSMPDDVADLIMSLLRRDPAQRAPSAEAVLAALDKVDMDALSDRAPPSSSAATLPLTYAVGKKILRFFGSRETSETKLRRAVELKIAWWFELLIPVSLLPIVFVFMHRNDALGQLRKRLLGHALILAATALPFLVPGTSFLLDAVLGSLLNMGVHFAYNLFVSSAPLTLGDGRDAPPATRIQFHEVTDWSLFSPLWAKPAHMPEGVKVQFNAFYNAFKNRIPVEDQPRIMDVFVSLIIRMQARIPKPENAQQRLEQVFQRLLAPKPLRKFDKDAPPMTPAEQKVLWAENLEKSILQELLADAASLHGEEDREPLRAALARARYLGVSAGKFAPFVPLLDGPDWLWAAGNALSLSRGTLTREVLFREFAEPLSRAADGPETFRSWSEKLLPVLKKSKGEARTQFLADLRLMADLRDPAAFGRWVEERAAAATAGGRWNLFRPLYDGMESSFSAHLGPRTGRFMGQVLAPTLVESGLIVGGGSLVLSRLFGLPMDASLGFLQVVWHALHGRQALAQDKRDISALALVLGLAGNALFPGVPPQTVFLAALLLSHASVNAIAIRSVNALALRRESARLRALMNKRITGDVLVTEATSPPASPQPAGILRVPLPEPRPNEPPLPALRLDGRPPRVLIVEDNRYYRQKYANLLNALGTVIVEEAEDGQHGLEKAQAILSRGDPLDLVITDLNMPFMNGGRMILELRKQWPALPALLVTGAALMEGDLRQLNVIGRNKPEDEDDFKRLGKDLGALLSLPTSPATVENAALWLGVFLIPWAALTSSRPGSPLLAMIGGASPAPREALWTALGTSLILLGMATSRDKNPLNGEAYAAALQAFKNGLTPDPEETPLRRALGEFLKAYQAADHGSVRGLLRAVRQLASERIFSDKLRGRISVLGKAAVTAYFTTRGAPPTEDASAPVAAMPATLDALFDLLRRGRGIPAPSGRMPVERLLAAWDWLSALNSNDDEVRKQIRDLIQGVRSGDRDKTSLAQALERLYPPSQESTEGGGFDDMFESLQFQSREFEVRLGNQEQVEGWVRRNPAAVHLTVVMSAVGRVVPLFRAEGRDAADPLGRWRRVSFSRREGRWQMAEEDVLLLNGFQLRQAAGIVDVLNGPPASTPPTSDGDLSPWVLGGLLLIGWGSLFFTGGAGASGLLSIAVAGLNPNAWGLVWPALGTLALGGVLLLRRRVLLVDDREAVAEWYRDYLKELDYPSWAVTVERAEGGREALARVAETADRFDSTRPYDLVIVQRPGAGPSPDNITRRLRARFPGMPVLPMTGQSLFSTPHVGPRLGKSLARWHPLRVSFEADGWEWRMELRTDGLFLLGDEAEDAVSGWWPAQYEHGMVLDVDRDGPHFADDDNPARRGVTLKIFAREGGEGNPIITMWDHAPRPAGAGPGLQTWMARPLENHDARRWMWEQLSPAPPPEEAALPGLWDFGPVVYDLAATFKSPRQRRRFIASARGHFLNDLRLPAALSAALMEVGQRDMADDLLARVAGGLSLREAAESIAADKLDADPFPNREAADDEAVTLRPPAGPAKPWSLSILGHVAEDPFFQAALVLLLSPVGEEFLFRDFVGALPLWGWWVMGAVYVAAHYAANDAAARAAGLRGRAAGVNMAARFLVQALGTALLTDLYITHHDLARNIRAHMAMNAILLLAGFLFPPLRSLSLTIRVPRPRRQALNLEAYVPAKAAFDAHVASPAMTMDEKGADAALKVFLAEYRNVDGHRGLMTAVRKLVTELTGDLKAYVAVHGEAAVHALAWHSAPLPPPPSDGQIYEHNERMLSPLTGRDREMPEGLVDDAGWKTWALVDAVGRITGFTGPPAPGEGPPQGTQVISITVRLLHYLHRVPPLRWAYVGGRRMPLLERSFHLENQRRWQGIQYPPVTVTPRNVLAAWNWLESLGDRQDKGPSQKILVKLIQDLAAGRAAAASLDRTLWRLFPMDVSDTMDEAAFSGIRAQESRLRVENARRVGRWLSRHGTHLVGDAFTVRLDAVGRVVSVSSQEEWGNLENDPAGRWRLATLKKESGRWRLDQRRATTPMRVPNHFQRRMALFLAEDLGPAGPSGGANLRRRPSLASGEKKAPAAPKAELLFFLPESHAAVVRANAEALTAEYGDFIAGKVYGVAPGPERAGALMAGTLDGDGRIATLGDRVVAAPVGPTSPFHIALGKDGFLSFQVPNDVHNTLDLSFHEMMRRVRMKVLGEGESVLAGWRRRFTSPAAERRWLLWLRPMLERTVSDYDDVLALREGGTRSPGAPLMRKFEKLLTEWPGSGPARAALIGDFLTDFEAFFRDVSAAAGENGWPRASMTELERVRDLLVPALSPLRRRAGAASSPVSAAGESLVPGFLLPALKALTRDQLLLLADMSDGKPTVLSRVTAWWRDLVEGEAVAATVAAEKLAAVMFPARGGYRRFRALLAFLGVRREKPAGAAGELFARLGAVFASRGIDLRPWVMKGSLLDQKGVQDAVIAFHGRGHRQARRLNLLIGEKDLNGFMTSADPASALARMVVHEWAEINLKLSHEDVMLAGLDAGADGTPRSEGESLEEYVDRMMGQARRWKSLSEKKALLLDSLRKAVPPVPAAPGARGWMERHRDLLTSLYGGSSMHDQTMDTMVLLMQAQPGMPDKDVRRLLTFFQEMADIGRSRHLSPAFRAALEAALDDLESLLNEGLGGVLLWRNTLVGMPVGGGFTVKEEGSRWPAEPGGWVVGVQSPGFRYEGGRLLAPQVSTGEKPWAEFEAFRNALSSAIDRGAHPEDIAALRKRYRAAQDELFQLWSGRLLARLDRAYPFLQQDIRALVDPVKDRLRAGSYSLTENLRSLDGLAAWEREYEEGSPPTHIVRSISQPLALMIGVLSQGTVYGASTLENRSSQEIPAEAVLTDAPPDAMYVVHRVRSSGFLPARPDLGEKAVRARVDTFQSIDQLAREQLQGKSLFYLPNGKILTRPVRVVVDQEDGTLVAVGDNLLHPDMTPGDVENGLLQGQFRQLYVKFQWDGALGFVRKELTGLASMGWLRRLLSRSLGVEDYDRRTAWWLENALSLLAGLATGALWGAATAAPWLHVAMAAHGSAWVWFALGHVPDVFIGTAEERREARSRLTSALLFTCVLGALPFAVLPWLTSPAMTAFFLLGVDAFSFELHRWFNNFERREFDRTLNRLAWSARRWRTLLARGAPAGEIAGERAFFLGLRAKAIAGWRALHGDVLAAALRQNALAKAGESAALPSDVGNISLQRFIDLLQDARGDSEVVAWDLSHAVEKLPRSAEGTPLDAALNDLWDILLHDELLEIPGRSPLPEAASGTLLKADVHVTGGAEGDEEVLPLEGLIPAPAPLHLDHLFPRPGTDEPLRVAVRPVVENTPEAFELRSALQDLGYLASQIEWAPAADLSASPHITVSRTAEFISIKARDSASLFLPRSDKFRAGLPDVPREIRRYLRPFVPDAFGRLVSGHGERVLLDWVVTLIHRSGWDAQARTFRAASSVLEALGEKPVADLAAFLTAFRLDAVLKGPLPVPAGLLSSLIQAAGGKVFPRGASQALNSPEARWVYDAFHKRGIRVAFTLMEGVPPAPGVKEPMIVAFRVPIARPEVKAMHIFLDASAMERMSAAELMEDLAYKIAHEYGRTHLGLTHKQMAARGVPVSAADGGFRLTGFHVEGLIDELMGALAAPSRTPPAVPADLADMGPRLPFSFNGKVLDVRVSDLSPAEFRGHGSPAFFELTFKGELTPMKMSLQAGMALSLLPAMDVDESDYWSAGGALGEVQEMANLYLPLLRKDPRASAEAQRVFWEAWRRIAKEPALYENTILPLAALLHHAGVTFTDVFDESWKGLSSDMRFLALGAPGLPADPAAAALRLDEAWNAHYDEMRRRLSRLDSLARLTASPAASGAVRIYDVSYLLDGGNGLRRDGLVRALRGEESTQNSPLLVADRPEVSEATLLRVMREKGVALDPARFLRASREVSNGGYVLAPRVDKFLKAKSIQPDRLDFITPLPDNIRTAGMNPFRVRIWELLDDELVRDVSAGLEKALERVRFTKVSA